MYRRKCLNGLLAKKSNIRFAWSFLSLLDIDEKGKLQLQMTVTNIQLLRVGEKLGHRA